MVLLIFLGVLSAAVISLLGWKQGAVEAQAPASSTRTTARFVALQPPPAGDNTYGNFLWVLDSVTGEVTAYRIASMKADSGKHEFWMTERLVTEKELSDSQKK